jgi:hypothetical protein
MKKQKTVKRTGLPKAPPPIHTMGVVLPRNALNKELVHQHVVATQEYDHRRAELIANFIVDLGNLYKETQPKKMSYLKIAAEQLYDLDEKIGMEFHTKTPRLFMSVSHGFILAELCEIRSLINCAINCNEKEKKSR